MGLDQYLVAKFKDVKETNNLTGACGGLFPMAPKSDKTEIGYWRKFYKLDDLIREEKQFTDDEWDEKNCEDIRLTKADCKYIQSYAEEEVYALEEWYEGNMGRLENSEDFWDYQDWETTIDIMKKAIKMIEEDKAKIYYKYWR